MCLWCVSRCSWSVLLTGRWGSSCSLGGERRAPDQCARTATYCRSASYRHTHSGIPRGKSQLLLPQPHIKRFTLWPECAKAVLVLLLIIISYLCACPRARTTAESSPESTLGHFKKNFREKLFFMWICGCLNWLWWRLISKTTFI